VADDLVDRRADRAREHVVAERARVRVALHALGVDDLVNLERRDARPDGCRRNVEDLASVLFRRRRVSFAPAQGGRNERERDDAPGRPCACPRSARRRGPDPAFRCRSPPSPAPMHRFLSTQHKERGRGRVSERRAHVSQPVGDRARHLLGLGERPAAPHAAPPLPSRREELTVEGVVGPRDVVGHFAHRDALVRVHGSQRARVLVVLDRLEGIGRCKDVVEGEREEGWAERSAWRPLKEEESGTRRTHCPAGSCTTAMAWAHASS